MRTLKQQQVVSWLAENLPHIQLVHFSGNAKDVSTFLNTLNNTQFNISYKALRDNHKRGRSTGLTQAERVAKRAGTWEKKYGGHPKTIDFVQQKYVQTCEQRYGASNYFASSDWKEKAKHVYKTSLGVTNPSKSQAIQDKIEATTLERHGVRRFAQKDQITHKGQTVPQLAASTGLSKCYVYALLNVNVDPTQIDKGSSIETVIATYLDSLNVTYTRDKKLPTLDIRPDFYIPSHNLVIECDGLYWHSDVVIKDRLHHQKRLNAYKQAGITALFFREHEILNKLEPIKSIILHKLNLSTRVYARKLVVDRTDSQLLEKNHLMGKGQGRVYSLLAKDGTILASMQVKGKHQLEISRFCTAHATSVVGGFSKLLNAVIQQESPTSISTFIDLRYGRGDYLTTLGFNKATEHVSFQWTKGTSVSHRRTFPGSTGYDHGYNKIWDCGQAKWVREVT